MRIISRLVFSGAVLSLAGCGLGETFRVEPFNEADLANQGSFNSYLAAEYQVLSRSEAYTETNWRHAGIFSKKGRAAAAGETVLPSVPASHNIDPADEAALAAGRNRLIAALDSGGRERSPKECAKAQAGFDDWLEESHDNDYGEMTDKDTGKTRLLYGPVQASNVSAGKANFEKWVALCEGRAVAAQDFIIYFEFDKSKITDAAGAVLDEVTKTAGGASINVVGHTDTSGSNTYNEKLSEQRAKSTAVALGKRGAAVGTVSWEGELHPAVPSGDGVREPLNRRAVVSIVK